jgi:hypothetical protein
MAIPVSARGTILGFDRSRNKKPGKRRGEMRELGVRSPLRTEGAAWARAPGQRHRDRNVRNQILSVKGVPARCCRPLTPDLAHCHGVPAPSHL